MNKFIKFISAAIIIIALIFGAVIAWKVTDNIRQSLHQDLQESFKDSLKEYGKR
jgi:hypothetical protein